VRSIWKVSAAGTAALALAAAPAAAAAAGPAGAPAVQRACSAPAGPDYAQCLVLVRTNVATHKGVVPDVTPAGYGPSSLQAAYSLKLAAAGSGKGQTVAVVDAYDDPDADSDLAVYRAQYGLPPCTTANGCFSKVNEDGEASPLPAAAGSTGWATEESLDLDMVSAVCPNCHILLVEANSDLVGDLGTAVDAAVTLGAKFVSNSYAAPEASADTSYNAYYDHPGVAVTAAAGDSGYGVEYPAASPYVTAVGGTELVADSSAARGWAEQVWGDGTSGADGDGTGSGCSAYQAKPSWQADTGCANRTVADVAADADPETGAAVYDSYDQSGWLEVGGTSEATPIIAATYALAGAPGASDNPAKYPYEHTGELNDVTSGSNGTCSPAYLCSGGPGYNGPAGNGTPDGTSAFQATDNTVTVSAPAAQTSITGKAITALAVAAADSDPSQALTWRATGLPAGLSISSSTGVISGKPARLQYATVTVTATDDTGASGSARFTWRVDGKGAITSGLSSGRCITDRSGKIRIERCDGARSQKWLVTPLSNGTVTIALAGATGTCVSVQGARTASGTKLVASRCVITASQEWKPASHGHLTGKRSAKCVTDPGSGGNGTQLEIAACKVAAAEHWNLP
jgi:hypothetical protein